ncbi:hypothetical protein ACFPVY_01930 [Flavobacterium qiangtangense]|uniref:Lipoprotein n=1 Tax=Flavobacterium qiangtangense TaxID=1442595 RepID=A0ABW1PIF2_9FLAO
MKNLKMLKITAVGAICLVAQACSNRNESNTTAPDQQPYVKNEGDKTLEDGGNIRTDSGTETGAMKDSATVGPVAPKSPASGGRSN